MVHYNGHALVGSWARLEGAIFLYFRRTFPSPHVLKRGVLFAQFTPFRFEANS